MKEIEQKIRELIQIRLSPDVSFEDTELGRAVRVSFCGAYVPGLIHDKMSNAEIGDLVNNIGLAFQKSLEG